MTPRKSKDELGLRAPDYVASAARAVGGFAPIVGPLVAELAGAIVPNQRMDRIAEFCRELDVRVAKLEQASVESQLENPEFSSLLEEGLQQSARVVSSERRAEIAELIAHSLEPGEIEYAESEHVLRILRDLNDVEVIRLGSYLHRSYARDEYRERHHEALAPALASYASSQREKDAAALQQSYDLHLERLGLLRVQYAVDPKTHLPRFDPRTGAQEVRGHEINASRSAAPQTDWRSVSQNMVNRALEQTRPSAVQSCGVSARSSTPRRWADR